MDTVFESPLSLKRVLMLPLLQWLKVCFYWSLSEVGCCLTACNISQLWCAWGWVGPLPPRNPQVSPIPLILTSISGLCFGSETHVSEIRFFWWVRQGSPCKKSVDDEKLPKLRKWLKSTWGAMETEGGLPVINCLSVWLEVFLNTHLQGMKNRISPFMIGQRCIWESHKVPGFVFDYKKRG